MIWAKKCQVNSEVRIGLDAISVLRAAVSPVRSSTPTPCVVDMKEPVNPPQFVDTVPQRLGRHV